MMDTGHGGKIRVKTGCKTCRIRRIKCDEGKPKCNRCMSTGRICDGYDIGWSRPRPRSQSHRSSPEQSGPSRGSSSSPRPITLPTFDDERQRESFSFFVLCTAATQSSLSHSTDFWSQRVLQLSLVEPAIRYALCSLSALHRKFREGTSSTSNIQDECVSYSLEQYTLAVRHTQQLLSLSENEKERNDEVIIKGIVACILFICYENLTGNFATAQMHLRNGMRILSRSSSPSNRDYARSKVMIPQDIRRVFSRLDLQAMSFADHVAPYMYEDSSHFQLLDPPDSFEDINEAMDYLIHNFRWIFHTASACEPVAVPASILSTAERMLEKWETRFSFLITHSDTETIQKATHTITLLNIYHATMKIILGTGIYGHENLHDLYTAEYSQIVAWAESLLASERGRNNKDQSGEEKEREQIFSFEPGLIFMLFFTAIKCRVSILRWRAIVLLGSSSSFSSSSPKAMRYQEGAWESRVAAAVAEFVVRIEEENCGREDEDDRVPLECERAHVVKVAASIPKREIQVSCVFLTPSEGEGYRVREGRVTY